MSKITIDGCDLNYERQGDGHPLVLVHGSWGDSMNWFFVAPKLAEMFDVVTYDRRGHGQSTSAAGPGSRSQDEDDLVALVEALGLTRPYAVGNSFGASIVLGTAARHPELFARISGHEPPLLSLITDPDAMHLVDEQHEDIAKVLEYLDAGRDAEGAEYFVENVGLGPGAWALLPDMVRETFIRHAPTFLDEQRDPNWDRVDLDALARYPERCLLTHGAQSLEWFDKVIGEIAARVPSVEREVMPTAGHVPQMTNPDDLVDVLIRFFS